ncbi:MAG: type I DNA topoisomerase [Bacilli bacterium]
MKLILVESPKKSQTFTRYLGQDYLVLATKGHIRDLATSGPGGLGIDLENDFKPNYKIIPSKIPVLKEISTNAKKASEIIIATDPDREGEAIAWHLADYLKLDLNKTKRMEFHEITRDAIKEALENPRNININTVNSQETRRILDRIIGFKLSRLLQKKVHSPSAGRVQSAALKMICDHELIIQDFIPLEYWEIIARVKICAKEYDLKLTKFNNKTSQIKTKEEAETIFNKLGDQLLLHKLITKKRTIVSKPPFKTSTLQQEASNRFRFSTSKTLSIAQTLYEGVQIGDELVGLISYIRTDSTRLSLSYIRRAQNYISETFGRNYLGRAKDVINNELSQDAHEAIRPTSNHRTPDKIAGYLTSDQLKIYRLIYNRALASLMVSGVDEVSSAYFISNDLEFKFETKKVIFDGFRILYDEEDDLICTPLMKEGDELDIIKKEMLQKFTTPPSRYTEARVVQLMEEAGIGRPSTYASTIRLLLNRKYIESTKEGLKATPQGIKTSIVMNKYFPEFVDSNYTATIENDLDQIQFGQIKHIEWLNDFYLDFEEKVKKADVVMYKDPVEETGENCPVCGSLLVIKQGKHGEFVGCSNFPTCKYTKKTNNNNLETGEDCPKCGRPLVKKQFPRRRPFIGCSGYPDCDYIKPNKRFKKQSFYKKK